MLLTLSGPRAIPFLKYLENAHIKLEGAIVSDKDSYFVHCNLATDSYHGSEASTIIGEIIRICHVR